MNKPTPLYKTGDVVRLTEHYTATVHESLAGLMIVLSFVDWSTCNMLVYELLAGDVKIFLYEDSLELVCP